MTTEAIFETGRVISVLDGKAEVEIIKAEHCSGCSAKSICNVNDGVRNVLARDPLGVSLGDKVRLSIQGIDLVKMSVLFYGIPLIILVIGIFIGFQFFYQSDFKELYSFLLAVILIVIYYFSYYFFQKKYSKKELLPIIVEILH